MFICKKLHFVTKNHMLNSLYAYLRSLNVIFFPYHVKMCVEGTGLYAKITFCSTRTFFDQFLCTFKKLKCNIFVIRHVSCTYFQVRPEKVLICELQFSLGDVVTVQLIKLCIVIIALICKCCKCNFIDQSHIYIQIQCIFFVLGAIAFYFSGSSIQYIFAFF